MEGVNFERLFVITGGPGSGKTADRSAGRTRLPYYAGGRSRHHSGSGSH